MSQSNFVKGTLILSVATLLSKILGSVFRIPLQNIAGDEVLGIFSLVFPVYMVALILSVAGIPIAISKLIAEAKAKNESHSIRDIYLTASILAIIFGVLSFTLIYSFSVPIAAALGGQSTRLALIVVAGTLLVAPYMAVYRGFFQGFDDMQPTAISQVLEQFIRVAIILGVAYYLVVNNYSNEIVAGGVMAGSVIGALASLIYLRLKYNSSSLKVSSNVRYSLPIFTKWSKLVLRTSIPIAIGTITMALLNVVDSFTVSYGLKSLGNETSEINYLYGIYGRGLSLVQIATVFATSIVLPLIPLISKNLANNDTKGTRTIIEKTHYITHLISWPSALGLLALTLPLNLALFTNLEGSMVLAIIGFSAVFTSLTVLGTGVLQGMNLAKYAAYIIIAGVIIKIFTNILFIHLFGLTGAALSTLLVYVLLFSVNSLLINRHLSSKLFTVNTWKMIFASLVMGAIVGLPTLFFSIINWTRTEALLYVLAAIVAGSIIYLIQLFLFKAIDKQMIGNLPVINKFLK
ncbi:putative polysaccharide biosynthesis protein [Virgibacillus sp. DJP39]|uniref:putative polysaccharide biosynthesis protein n=1 Tax=Virgibacillus sp. DJP39 TaxID=3409790 RepID=UPI003BB71E88